VQNKEWESLNFPEMTEKIYEYLRFKICSKLPKDSFSEDQFKEA
jgi:hypothetical protein